MTLEAGTRVGKYKIKQLLGAGGMGEVYLAEDTGLNRKVALKLLPAELTDREDRLRRFEQEAQAASALSHPNILTVHEFGKEDDSHFIVTEFVEGLTLREKLADGRVPVGEALDVAAQVASALSAAHEAGIIHRDIKPDNIMIRRDGFVKVLDFGLAKLAEKKGEDVHETDSEAPTRAQVNTNPGAVMGTVEYMSPEQARGLRVDSRTDIFSLGVVLYEMLAGHKPFAGATPTDVIVSVVDKEPPPLASYAPDVPAEISWIVTKSLCKERDGRYQTAKELLSDLRRLKHRLEFEAELERSVAPQQRTQDGAPTTLTGPHGTTGAQGAARTAGAGALTAESNAVHTTSSAEYVVGEIKKHKFASLAISVLVSLALAAGVYFLFFAGRAASFESIAVLPLVNASGDKETEFLSDGITETLINNFTKIPTLRVTARSTAFRYKSREIEPRQIGKELGVGAILTGRVLQRGDSLSIQVDLINAADGSQIWGNQYNGKASEVLDVQQRIARDVSESLKWKLSGAQERQIARNYTQDAEAYQLYLKGRFYWNRRTAENIRKAIEQFRAAADKDPNYALAYVGLADCYVLLEEYAGTPPSETLPQAKAYATRALQIDESLAEAHASSGIINFNLWQWSEAEREYKRAIELNPNYPTAHHWYSVYLRSMRRFDEALAEIKRARELDPLSLVINTNIGLVYSAKGDTNSAAEQFKKTIDLDPNYSAAHMNLGNQYRIQGRHTEALAELQRGVELSGRSSNALSYLGYASALTGKRNEAIAIAKELEEKYAKGEAIGQDIATVYAGLGERDVVFAWLEKDFQARSGQLIDFRSDTEFDSLRSDPRYSELLRRMNLPQ